MREALKQAEIALDEGEVPVGAVVVSGNRIIAKAYNQTERLNDATAHAEMIALTSATNYLGNKYLNECTLYVTLEPCVMCAGAIFWSQLDELCFGAYDPKRGYQRVGSLLHPKTRVSGGIMQEESAQLINRFFKALRDKSL